MKTEESSQKPPSHLPPRHISEAIKDEMDKETKRPPDPNTFLNRLLKMRLAL